MRNLWKNLPAWLRAILLNLVLLFPVVTLIQVVIALNFEYLPTFGWGLLLVVPLLAGYWKLVNKWNPFRAEGDIRLTLQFDWTHPGNGLKILGLCLFTVSSVTLFMFFTPVEDSLQMQFINSFKALSPITAIPLLLALALSAGIAEEVTYRGFVQNTLQRRYVRLLSYGLVGVLFASAHVLPLPLIAPYVLVSIAFSIVADQLRATGVVILAQALVDFLLFLNIYYDVWDFAALTSVNVVITLVMFFVGAFLVLRKFGTSADTKLKLGLQ